jgi:hypothetical protein
MLRLRSTVSLAATTPYTCSGQFKPESSSIFVTLMEYICRVLSTKAPRGRRPGVLCVKCIGLNDAAAINQKGRVFRESIRLVQVNTFPY